MDENNILNEGFLFRHMLRRDLEKEIRNALKECEERNFDNFEKGMMIQMTLSLFFKSYDVAKAQAVMDELGVDIDMENLMKEEFENACVKYLY